MTTSDGLGCRSRLVLEKLGFDLRSCLESTFAAPLPADLQKLADELGGYAEWQDVGDPPRPAAEPARLERPWHDFVAADRPFHFS